MKETLLFIIAAILMASTNGPTGFNFYILWVALIGVFIAMAINAMRWLWLYRRMAKHRRSRPIRPV